MKWNDHSKYEGLHAFLGPSKYSWLRWDDNITIERYLNSYAADVGTIIHELAQNCIKNRIKLNMKDKHIIDITLLSRGIPRNSYDAEMILGVLVPFVNDAIGFRMDSEVILYYDFYCFGTADAILYDEKSKTLRIHDLKTGISPASMEQLMIYAALFFLEYNIKPRDMENIELRIYQNTEIENEFKPNVICLDLHNEEFKLSQQIESIMLNIIKKVNLLKEIL